MDIFALTQLFQKPITNKNSRKIIHLMEDITGAEILDGRVTVAANRRARLLLQERSSDWLLWAMRPCPSGMPTVSYLHDLP